MEDFVEYQIYNAELLNVSQNCQQDKATFITFGQSLINCITKLTSNYLWRKDSFYIEPKFINDSINGARSNVSYFEGVVYYGGDINDEWFIVYLLYKLSEINKNILIEIRDNDGQFLLIHSAYNLPKWIKPQNVENRVFIHEKKLHLIPLIYNNLNNNKQKAINLILNDKMDTFANDNIQNSIVLKLNQFENKIYKNPGVNYHFSVVVLPKKCANILDKYPFIISNVVDCFVNGSDKTRKIKFKKERKFKLDPLEYVFVSVRFTQYLYAILSFKSLKSAPIYFRKHKFDFNGYENKLKLDKKVIKNAFLNGIKLMIGFEIFYAKCANNEMNIDREWIKFKSSLIKKGYFAQFVIGSDSYQKKQESAKTYYEENMKQKNEKRNMLFCNGNNKNVSFYLNAMNDMKENENNNEWIEVYGDGAINNKLRNDKEDWMKISDEELKELLNEYSFDNNNIKQQMLFEEMLDDDDSDQEVVNDNDDQQTKDDILSLKESLNTFMDKKSCFDGVEMENENDNEMEFDAEKVLDILDEEKKNKNDMKQNEIKEIMNEMDKELSMKEKKEKNENELEEDIDIDLNIVNNILQSHVTSQMNGNGLGPAATLLSQMGFKLK